MDDDGLMMDSLGEKRNMGRRGRNISRKDKISLSTTTMTTMAINTQKISRYINARVIR